MVQPIYDPPPRPLSAEEREMMTEEDWEILDAWRFRVGDRKPSEVELVRLYLRGYERGVNQTADYMTWRSGQ